MWSKRMSFSLSAALTTLSPGAKELVSEEAPDEAGLLAQALGIHRQ